MANKRHLGLFFGGRSCEHEVSVISARSVLPAIDRDKYDVSLIGIDHDGHWHLAADIDALIEDGRVRPTADGRPAPLWMELHAQGNLRAVDGRAGVPGLDVILSLLHGTLGEDGAMQGVFELADIPYVGCGVAASAVAMDKALAKPLFHAAGIPQVEYAVVNHHQWRQQPEECLDRAERVSTQTRYPLFVKPANMGSSVGVSKAGDRTRLIAAIELALRYDSKVVIERAMQHCHEVECAVLGNLTPAASVAGEIIPGAEFYDYRTKYLDDRSQLIIPANIAPESAAEVQRLALQAFRAIDGRGMARVDFFVEKDAGRVFLNELNTLPGFTPISMYPRLWAASGVAYGELIDRLIELALENHRSKAGLERSAVPVIGN